MKPNYPSEQMGSRGSLRNNQRHVEIHNELC
nr:MAG TPA: hypothetical protein [Caudoviricetes sp.]